jgi:polyhydroxyalkanoate synthesis regulator phasin
MEALFKKFLYTGVGLVASTAEKVQSNINETIDKTKESEKEGEKVVTDLMKDTGDKYQEVEDRLRSALDSALARFNLPNADEFNALRNKVAELEAELAKKSELTETVVETKAVATKTVAKKATTARRRTTKATTETTEK